MDPKRTLKAEILEVFFQAMILGYASSSPRGTLRELPGAKTTNFVSGSYRMLDYWFTNPNSNQSFGHTIIWKDGIPVFTMSYQGIYPKHSIPFLKMALKENYRRRVFQGGRGPVHYGQFNLRYSNQVTENNPAATDISGFEQIFDGERCIGYHRYQIMFLID